MGILGHNSPEWLFSCAGAVFAGALPAGVYSTSGPDTVRYMAAHAPFGMFLADDAEELRRVTPKGMTLREAFPDVKKYFFCCVIFSEIFFL